ncbi:MAG TPA: hypothetical protein VKY65_07090 [Alphaproteobacteria bacterium]|nr:hypothetical protein [Alphaproteobacteria bacterium]
MHDATLPYGTMAFLLIPLVGALVLSERHRRLQSAASGGAIAAAMGAVLAASAGIPAAAPAIIGAALGAAAAALLSGAASPAPVAARASARRRGR